MNEELYYKESIEIPVLGGSSSLVLANEVLAHEFFSQIVNDVCTAVGGKNYLFPEIFDYNNPGSVAGPGTSKWWEDAVKCLEPPREILRQAYGKMICLGGDLIFFPGVTAALVKEFNNRPFISSGQFEEILVLEGGEEKVEYRSAPEYPEFDEFGNLFEVSWLTEYALRTGDFCRKANADFFLNLEWNEPEAELPTPFWLLFDRIYKIKKNANGKILMAQVR